MGFLHVGQADLELPVLGDLHTSTSQSTGITSVSHHTQPPPAFFALSVEMSFLILLQTVYFVRSNVILQSLGKCRLVGVSFSFNFYSLFCIEGIQGRDKYILAF